MTHTCRKIYNAIPNNKRLCFMKQFPAVKKLWSVLSMHLLNSCSTTKSASFDTFRKGNLHNENIIFVIKIALISNSTTRNYQMRNVQALFVT
jgi:hypothetical protein